MIAAFTMRSAHASQMSLPVNTPTAPSDETARIRALMQEGGAKFAQGDYPAAYAAYQKAWEIKPHSAVAANMAAAEIRLGRYLQAAVHLKYALNHLPLVHLDKRDAVEDQLDEVREHLVAVTLSANLDGVEISIDGRRLGRTPLPEEVLLEPGHHAISAVYSNVSQTKAIDVNAGARLSLLFDLGGAESSKTPASDRAPMSLQSTERPAITSNRTRTWVLVSGAAASAISLGVGITLSIQSANERDDARTLQAQLNGTSTSFELTAGNVCARQEQAEACNLLHRSTAAADRDRNLSTGAFVAAGALGLGTVTTALLWPSRGTRSQPPTAGTQRLHLGTWAANKGYGVNATFSF